MLLIFEKIIRLLSDTWTFVDEMQKCREVIPIVRLIGLIKIVFSAIVDEFKASFAPLVHKASF